MTPELAVATPEEAADLARALDLDETTVSTWLTRGIGITARRGAATAGLAHLVDDGGHAEVADLVLAAPDDDIAAALVQGAEQIATDVVPTTEAMHSFGSTLATELRAGDIVLASGDLGAGKTTLAQGIGMGLGVEGPVISPTFVLARRHAGVDGRPGLVHVDAYRLGSAAELVDLDLDETMDQAVTLIEWGAGIAEDLGGSHLDIDIRRSGDPADETRVVYLEGFGPRWQDVDLSPLSEFPLGTTPDETGDNI